MKVRRVTPDEIRVRATQLFVSRLERHGLWPDARLRPVRALLRPACRNLTDVQLLAAYRARTSPPTLVDDATTQAVLAVRHGRGHASTAPLAVLADGYEQGRFPLLGFEAVDFGVPVDWQLEPSTGRRPPFVHWSRIPYLDAEVVGDKKVTWELNRHQHLITLGRAYRLTRDERFAALCLRHLREWMVSNPPKIGINWASSLELAFRVISWLWTLEFVRGSPTLDPETYVSVLQFAHLHGAHLQHFLSTYFSPNTHLTGEALGLLYLGCRLPELARAGQWRDLGLSILLRELDRQVREDGIHFEQATWYQRYTVDFYLHLLLLAERHGLDLPLHFQRAVSRLVDPMLWMTRPDGTFPSIGDDDGGRFVPLDDSSLSDWRPTLSTAAVLLHRADCKSVAGELAEETVWLLGPSAVERYARLPATAPVEMGRAFPAGGYYVMRSGWTSDADWALIDCGPHGVMNCGHAHADALSFELSIAGKPFIIDPGTLTYTGSADWRDRMRSSLAHNTIVVDGASSSVPSGPFSWRHVAHCSPGRWVTTSRFDYFDGAHDGYARLSDPVLHRRAVFQLRGEYWLFHDRLEARLTHEYRWRAHLAPGVRARVTGGGSGVHAESDSAAYLRLQAHGGDGRWSVSDDWTSPTYGRRVGAALAEYVWTGEGAQTLTTLALPGPRSRAIDGLGPDTRRVIELEAACGGRDQFAFDGLAGLDAGSWRSEADFTWVSCDDVGRPREAIVIGMRSFEIPTVLRLRAARPVSFVWLHFAAHAVRMTGPAARSSMTLSIEQGIGRLEIDGVAEEVAGPQIVELRERAGPLPDGAGRPEIQ